MNQAQIFHFINIEDGFEVCIKCTYDMTDEYGHCIRGERMLKAGRHNIDIDDIFWDYDLYTINENELIRKEANTYKVINLLKDQIMDDFNSTF